MAGTGSVTIQGAAINLASGTRTLGPITMSSGPATEQSLAAVTTVILGNGANTITIPSTTATACVIVMDPTSTQTKTLKGVTGDTGIAVTKLGTCVLQFDAAAAPANFVITSGAADTGKITEIWFI